MQGARFNPHSHARKLTSAGDCTTTLHALWCFVSCCIQCRETESGLPQHGAVWMQDRAEALQSAARMLGEGVEQARQQASLRSHIQTEALSWDTLVDTRFESLPCVAHHIFKQLPNQGCHASTALGCRWSPTTGASFGALHAPSQSLRSRWCRGTPLRCGPVLRGRTRWLHHVAPRTAVWLVHACHPGHRIRGRMSFDPQSLTHRA